MKTRIIKLLASIAAMTGLGALPGAAWGATTYSSDSGYSDWSYTTLYAWRATSVADFSSGNSMGAIAADGTIGDASKQTWGDWCSGKSSYAAPGYGLVYDGVGTAAISLDFSPLSLGGLYVISNGFTLGTSSNQKRGYEFGDVTGTTATKFKLEKSVDVYSENTETRWSSGFLGDATLEIADGAVFDFTKGGTTGIVKLFTYNPKTGDATASTISSILRMKGEGTLKVNTFTATGAVTLDYSALGDRTNTTVFIDGNLTIDSSTIIKLPSNVSTNTAYTLCSGTLTGGSNGVRQIYVGDTAGKYNVTFNGATISYEEVGAIEIAENESKTAAQVLEAGWTIVKLTGGTLDLSACTATNDPISSLYLDADSTGGTIILPEGISMTDTPVMYTTGTSVPTITWKVSNAVIVPGYIGVEAGVITLRAYPAPVHAWTFDTNGNDSGSSSTKINFTANNLETISRSSGLGENKAAIAPSGWSDTCPISTSGFTVSMSLKIDTGSSKAMFGIGAVYAGNGKGFAFATGDEGQFSLLSMSGNSPTTLITCSPSLAANRFHSYVLTCSSDKELKLYVDGAEIGTATYPNDLPTKGVQMSGYHGATPSGYTNTNLNFSLEDLKVFDGVLTGTQITNLVNEVPAYPEKAAYVGTTAYDDFDEAIAAAKVDGAGALKVLLRSKTITLATNESITVAADTAKFTLDGSGMATLASFPTSSTALFTLASTWTGTVVFPTKDAPRRLDEVINAYGNTNSKVKLLGTTGSAYYGWSSSPTIIPEFVIGGSVAMSDGFNGRNVTITKMSGSGTYEQSFSSVYTNNHYHPTAKIS